MKGTVAAANVIDLPAARETFRPSPEMDAWNAYLLEVGKLHDQFPLMTVEQMERTAAAYRAFERIYCPGGRSA